MGRLRFRGRDKVSITFLDRDVVPGSIKYVQNQDVHSYSQHMCKTMTTTRPK